MGYTTKFDGAIKFDRELTASEIMTIRKICSFGEDGDAEDLAKAIGYVHPEHVTGGDRGYSYIQIELTENLDGLEWDGGEKCYFMLTTLNVVMQAIMQKIPDLNFHGGMTAQGEEIGDVWAIEVVNNAAYRKSILASEASNGDGTKTLDVKMHGNDAKAETVRDYLKALLRELWKKDEDFSGKRPFGNSGWQSEVHYALAKAGFINGEFDEEDLIDYDEDEANRLIFEAIEAL